MRALVVAVIVAAVVAESIYSTPVGNPIYALGAGVHPGEAAVVNAEGVDWVPVATDEAAAVPLVHAVRANSWTDLFVLTGAGKLRMVPAGTHVQVRAVSAVERLPIVQVEWGADGSSTGWLPAAFVTASPS